MQKANTLGRVVGARMLLLALALPLFAAVSMAGVRQEWVAVYDSAGHGIDKGIDVAVGPSGDIVVIGQTRCVVSGSGPCLSTGLDYTTLAYDPDGALLWASRFNGPVDGDDVPSAMAIAPDGTIYVTGASEGAGTGKDFATLALDGSGNKLWVARYDGPGSGDDEARAIALDPSGTIYVTGASLGAGTGLDYATIAYDPAGKELWVARYDGPSGGRDEAAGVAVTTAGAIVVTGSSAGVGGGLDYATVAYNSEGRDLWVARLDGPAHQQDLAAAIATGPRGRLVVTGSIDDDGVTSDYGTAAYAPSGREQWLARYHSLTGDLDRPFAIGVGRSGGIYVTGRGFHAGTGADFTTVAYTGAGKERWVAVYSGTSPFDFQSAAGLALDRAENVYVTGESRSPSTSEYATAAYDHRGVELWEAVFAMPEDGYAIPAAIAVDGAGDAYVTGECKDALGSSDYCTIKYSQAAAEDEDEDSDETGDEAAD